MIGWIVKLVKYIPGISAIIEKLGADSGKAAEIRAQTEQEDIRGFYSTGRISAMHLWRYVKVLIAFLLALTFIAMFFLPDAGNDAVALLDKFVAAVSKILSLEMQGDM